VLCTKRHKPSYLAPQLTAKPRMTMTMFAGSCSVGRCRSLLRSASIASTMALLPSFDNWNRESSATRDSHCRASFCSAVTELAFRTAARLPRAPRSLRSTSSLVMRVSCRSRDAKSSCTLPGFKKYAPRHLVLTRYLHMSEFGSTMVTRVV
jgi:hypothetical protein